jgi:hypothetical protein
VRTGIVHRPPGRLGDELDRAMIRLQAEAREFAVRSGVPDQYPARITAAAPPAVAARPHTAAGSHASARHAGPGPAACGPEQAAHTPMGAWRACRRQSDRRRKAE